MALKSFQNIKEFSVACSAVIEASPSTCARFEVGRSWAQYKLFVDDEDFVAVRWVNHLEFDNPELSVTMSSYSPTEKQIQLYKHMIRSLSV